MQIDSLKYFYEVAMLKSISKVANNSHISQPALSQQLVKLEEGLGVTLLERSNKGVTLTPQGHILFKYSVEILKSYEHLIKELDTYKKGKKEIVVETNSTNTKYIINNVMKRILNEFKDYKVIINNNCRKEGHMNLLHNVSDIVVSNKRIDDITLQTDYLGSTKYVLVHNSMYKIKKIQEVPFIKIVDDVISEQDLSAINLLNNATIAANSLETIKECLNSYPSVALMPKNAVERELRENIFKEIDVEEIDVKYDVFITYRKDTRKSIRNKINNIIEAIEKNLNK